VGGETKDASPAALSKISSEGASIRREAGRSSTGLMTRGRASLQVVSASLKYAVVERERRFIIASLPKGITGSRDIVDRYLIGTRLRLREVREEDGTVTRKLGHKVRLSTGPSEVACTNFYLDDAEWSLLAELPAKCLRKRRHIVRRDGLFVAIDEHEDGTLIAEIDDHDKPSLLVPEWLDVVDDVSGDEAWTGVSLAR
jgi:CYTH domain-containing protein